MIIYDLVTYEPEQLAEKHPSLDPLREDNVLLEATLLDVLHYAFTSVTALLIDLRTSMYFGEVNTGVLVCRSVRELALKQDFVRHIWTLGDSRVQVVDTGLEFHLPMQSGGIKITAAKMQFYAGVVHNIGKVATSLDDGIGHYLQTTPHWDSEIEILSSSVRT